MTAGGDELGQVPHHVPKAVAMLPDTDLGLPASSLRFRKYKRPPGGPGGRSFHDMLPQAYLTLAGVRTQPSKHMLVVPDVGQPGHPQYLGIGAGISVEICRDLPSSKPP